MLGPDDKADDFLAVPEIRVDAFAICEIGRNHRLHVEPAGDILVHFVLKGEGYLECEGQRLALSAGSVALVPGNKRKSLCGSGSIQHEEDAGSGCAIQDGLIGFGAVADDAELVLGCAKLSVSRAGHVPLFGEIRSPTIVRAGTALVPIFDTLLEEVRCPRVGSKAFIGALMKQIFIVLLRSQPAESRPLLQSQHNPLTAVVAAIIDRPQECHMVGTLARRAGMSRLRFNEEFIGTYHCTPMEFVRSVRLSAAARLLKESNLPVKKIAETVGYVSRSRFSNAFQGKFGMAPSDFRRGSPEPMR